VFALDTGFQFKQNDPSYFDVLRTSALPALENAFGEDRRGWGYVEGAGILRRIQLDDSSNLRPTTADIIKLQLTFGHGVQNHMNDPTADVGIALNPGGGSARPIKGAAIPLAGLSAFLEHKWNDRWSSTVGYSLLDVSNTVGQKPDAFNRGHYALGNLLYTPVPNVMVGGELQYGRRENFADGFSADDIRIQFSFKFLGVSERAVIASDNR